MKWPPIETAPRDGTDILLTDGKHTTVGHWDEMQWAHNHGPAWFPLCNATRWMPLPPPHELDAAAPYAAPRTEPTSAEDGTHGNTVQGADASPVCPTCRGEEGLQVNYRGIWENCPTCKGTGEAKP